jgi:hypothetical protein
MVEGSTIGFAFLLGTFAFLSLYSFFVKENQKIYIIRILNLAIEKWFKWLEWLLVLGAISYISRATNDRNLATVLLITLILIYLYFFVYIEHIGIGLFKKFKKTNRLGAFTFFVIYITIAIFISTIIFGMFIDLVQKLQR